MNTGKQDEENPKQIDEKFVPYGLNPNNCEGAKK